MSRLSLRERLQPALLDRLVVEAGSNRISGGTDPDDDLTGSRLRHLVQRDLEWLLNASSLDNVLDLKRYPHIAQSVLNFGMPNLSGQTVTSLDPEQIAQRIASVIGQYEPRLSRVRVIFEPARTDTYTAALEFRIDAELWGWPTTQALTLRTHVNLDNGSVAVSDRERA